MCALVLAVNVDVVRGLMGAFSSVPGTARCRRVANLIGRRRGAMPHGRRGRRCAALPALLALLGLPAAKNADEPALEPSISDRNLLLVPDCAFELLACATPACRPM